jgi:hypothetical protein
MELELEEKKTKKKHYIGVADVQIFSAVTWAELREELVRHCEGRSIMKPYLGPKTSRSQRWFGEKFTDSRAMALMDAVHSMEDWYDPVERSRFFKTVCYDPRSRVYVCNRFRTTGLGIEPKGWHYDRFFEGKPAPGCRPGMPGEPFRLDVLHADIQVLSTEVEDAEEERECLIIRDDVKTFLDFCSFGL